METICYDITPIPGNSAIPATSGMGHFGDALSVMDILR